MKKNRRSVDVEHVKNSGFSGKLKSVGSFGKPNKNNDDSYAYPDEDDVFEKAPHKLFDSGELHFPISRELKSSTPARAHHHKVCSANMNVLCLFQGFDCDEREYWKT